MVRGAFPALCVAVFVAGTMVPGALAGLRGGGLERHPVVRRLLSEAATTSEPFEIFKVESPLSREKLGNLLGNLDLYHTGLVVYNRATNTNFTFEFTANHFGAFVPQVDASGTMHWDDGGFVVPVHDFDGEYWQRVKYMGDMVPSGMDDFMSFVERFNQTQTEYVVFEVQGPDKLYPSHTCYDFVFTALQYLYVQDYTTFFHTSIYRDDVILKASSVVTVDTADSTTNYQEVAKFFVRLHETLSKYNYTDALQAVGGPAFVKAKDTTYYKFDPEYPFVYVGYQSHSLLNN